MASNSGQSPRIQRTSRTLTQKLASVVLGFEAVVVALGGLVAYGLKALPGGIAPWWGIVGGGVLAVAMVITAGLVRYRAGIITGWVLQGLVLLSALVVPAMFLVGLVFGGMWVYAMVVGGRVDRRGAKIVAELNAQEQSLGSGTPEIT